jgi:anti-sigma factor RsiW
MPADVPQRYASMIASVRSAAERLGRKGLPPEEVAEAVGRAVTARRPRTRYVIGRDAKVLAVLARLLPDPRVRRAGPQGAYFKR